MVLLYTVVYGNDLTRKKGVVSCLDVLFDGDEQNNNVEQLSVLVLVWPVVYKIQLVKAQKKDLHIFEMEATCLFIYINIIFKYMLYKVFKHSTTRFQLTSVITSTSSFYIFIIT